MLVFPSRARRRGRPRKKATMIADIDTLPPLVFGEPSEFRELMVALVMTGAKTGSSNLRVAYEMTDEALPTVGSLYALVDSANTRVAVLEILEVVETTVREVTLEQAQHEAPTLEHWRTVHRDYWETLVPAVRKHLGEPDWQLTDDEPVISKVFRVV
ncbi:RNA-binding protein [Cryobacterium sp. LW097]|nr:RNA-binding protein [Cryobacterium sp. LW097]POH67934.1 ASCH domain-containing protein [Cryobacterium zongtaii]TFC59282.1 ASCH domain-containing protein [Cryobacterium sp. TMB1-7]TFC75957.1 ASCH domain-containing protein [Cryobacterium sp. TMB3-10]TFD40497.1 ASCH domain-containing protein [Cryobacterium sp. TMB3-12]